MHDALDPEVAGFLQHAGAVYPIATPPPGAELIALFAAGLPAAAPPMPARRFPMLRSMMSTVPGRVAAAAAGLTFVTAGLAAADALPRPLQQATANLGDVVGGDVPAPGGPTSTTPTTFGTTSTSLGTTPTTGGGSTPTTLGVATPTTAGGVIPPGTGGPTPPAPATTAEQAAHIHDIDEACGNHGAYVSYVARNGTEPPCATSRRAGSTPTTVTLAVGGGATPQPSATTGSSGGGPGAGKGESSGKVKG